MPKGLGEVRISPMKLLSLLRLVRDVCVVIRFVWMFGFLLVWNVGGVSVKCSVVCWLGRLIGVDCYKRCVPLTGDDRVSCRLLDSIWSNDWSSRLGLCNLFVLPTFEVCSSVFPCWSGCLLQIFVLVS